MGVRKGLQPGAFTKTVTCVASRSTVTGERRPDAGTH